MQGFNLDERPFAQLQQLQSRPQPQSNVIPTIQADMSVPPPVQTSDPTGQAANALMMGKAIPAVEAGLDAGIGALGAGASQAAGLSSMASTGALSPIASQAITGSQLATGALGATGAGAAGAASTAALGALGPLGIGLIGAKMLGLFADGTTSVPGYANGTTGVGKGATPSQSAPVEQPTYQQPMQPSYNYFSSNTQSQQPQYNSQPAQGGKGFNGPTIDQYGTPIHSAQPSSSFNITPTIQPEATTPSTSVLKRPDPFFYDGP